MNVSIEVLNSIRNYAASRQTLGIDDETLLSFLNTDPTLATAIADAGRIHEALQAEFGELLAKDEADVIAILQDDFINFYPANTVNPYIAMAGSGPMDHHHTWRCDPRQRRLRDVGCGALPSTHHGSHGRHPCHGQCNDA